MPKSQKTSWELQAENLGIEVPAGASIEDVETLVRRHEAKFARPLGHSWSRYRDTLETHCVLGLGVRNDREK